MNAATDSEKSPDAYISAEGSFDDILHVFSQRLLAGNDDLAAAGLSFLLEHRDFLKMNEEVRFERPEDRFDFDDAQERLLGGAGQYFVSLSRSSLLYALILTSNKALRVSFQSPDEVYGILKSCSSKSSLPFPFAPLDEYEGEKCILLHAVLMKKGCFTAKDLKKEVGNRCPLYYECRYVRKQKCCCREKNIADILNMIEKKGVLTLHDSGYICTLQTGSPAI